MDSVMGTLTGPHRPARIWSRHGQRASSRGCCPCLSGRGFTLIEMLAILAILVILMAMAAGASIRWHRPTRLRASARKACAGLDQARQWAVTHGKPAIFSFGNDSPLGRGYFVVSSAVHGVIGRTNYLPGGIVWSASSGFVRFRADGTTDDPEDRFLELTESRVNSGAWSVAVRVSRLTGRAKAAE